LVYYETKGGEINPGSVKVYSPEAAEMCKSHSLQRFKTEEVKRKVMAVAEHMKIAEAEVPVKVFEWRQREISAGRVSGNRMNESAIDAYIADNSLNLPEINFNGIVRMVRVI